MDRGWDLAGDRTGDAVGHGEYLENCNKAGHRPGHGLVTGVKVLLSIGLGLDMRQGLGLGANDSHGEWVWSCGWERGIRQDMRMHMAALD